ncbi:YbhB/YbcL family Raf kinase inhibitor-like protein [Candidatus Peregrinibacteria bacterium]|nr:YbhB/YbcL family Raf kinase inhibitor-like protein [Candidatus Peregrinibacteria bacterium]
MQITSPNFQHQQNIPRKFTCQGEDISPELNISDVPKNTASLALISDDPDAPNGDWVHWLIWNIAPETSSIAEGTDNSYATQGITSFGTSGYGGPCPPFGEHRYFFKLFALDKMLDIPPSSKKQDLIKAMQGYIIDEAVIMGKYKKI